MSACIKYYEKLLVILKLVSLAQITKIISFVDSLFILKQGQDTVATSFNEFKNDQFSKYKIYIFII